jgi:hypothetical protein
MATIDTYESELTRTLDYIDDLFEVLSQFA